MSGSVLATIAMVATLFGILKYTENEFDKNGMIFISMSIILLWVIPGGYLVILPLAIILSVISPAARSEWAEHRKTRIIAIVMVFLVMNLFAFYPVSEPSAPSEWGSPIATENPYASDWPSSEQYTYFYDGAVISLVNLRAPHTFAIWGQSSTSINLAVILGMHEDRMRQSIELMNEEIPGFNVDSESFFLEEAETEGEYVYSEATYTVKRFEIKRDGIKASLGTVLVVGFPSIGGELSILSVTRPAFPAQDDLFEELIINQYIAHIGN